MYLNRFFICLLARGMYFKASIPTRADNDWIDCLQVKVLRCFIVALLYRVEIIIVLCTHMWNKLPVANGFGESEFSWIVVGERFSNVDKDGTAGPAVTRLLSDGRYLGNRICIRHHGTLLFVTITDRAAAVVTLYSASPYVMT